MATENESHAEPMWKVERIAQEYESALKQGSCGKSIESLLAANLDLPQAELLRALIETELDVIGLGNNTIAAYCSRFPVYTTLIESLVNAPLDEVRPPVAEGLQIANYRIGRLLGKGGLGYVYAAEDLQQQSPVAIKILRPDRLHAKDGFYCDLFRNEALIGSALNHPRIIKLLASGEYNDLPFHVFEFVDGDTLRSFRGKRKLPPLTAAKLIAQVAETIHYSHQRGVVHRDLKPSNIIVDRSGRPHITDFGIALEDSQQGRGARIAGTPQYMSPEQLSGDADLVDGRSDIYSLGVILYETVTGVHPTLGQATVDRPWNEALAIKPATPLRQRIQVSPRLEQICMRALEKDPSQRFSTASDFARDLRRFIAVSRVKRAAPAALLSLLLLTCLVLLIPKLLFMESETHPGVAALNAKAADTLPVTTNTVITGTAANTDSLANGDQDTVLEERTVAAGASTAATASLESVLSIPADALSLAEAARAAQLILAELRTRGQQRQPLWEYFAGSLDNTLQSELIRQMPQAGLTSEQLVARIATESNPSIRSALLLALGGYSLEQLPQIQREQLLPDLVQAYCHDPQSSIHAAIAWLLQRWNFDTQLAELNQQLFRPAANDYLQWYTTLANTTLLVCPPPPQSSDRPSLPYAIATHEVTELQWSWNLGDTPLSLSGPTARLPKNFTTWHLCAEYCNRLSERSGLPPEEYCYEKVSQTLYRAYPDALQRRGFRMPTIVEWTLAARGNSTTQRYWGKDDSLLADYVNCRPHSAMNRCPVGTCKPNNWGLFDVLGNVSEWLHDGPHSDETLGNAAEFHVRGGSAWTFPEKVHVDSEFTLPGADPGERIGLRVAQSLPEKQRTFVGPEHAPELRPRDYPQIALRARQAVAVSAHAETAPPTRPIKIPLESTQLLITPEPNFVGMISKGDNIDVSLVIDNPGAEALQLSHISAVNLFAVDPAFNSLLVIMPGDSAQVPLRLNPLAPGNRVGRITLHWLRSDQKLQETHFDVTTYISAPAVAAIEDPLDATGSLVFDFGSVAPGTAVRQLITLLNVGNQKLSLTAAQAHGALQLRKQPTPVDVFNIQHAYFEFQMDTATEGNHSGSFEVTTNDPLVPTVNVSASVEIVELPLIPVLGLFRDGTWLLDSNHDGIQEQRILFGQSGDQPLAGDFDGDGTAELAILRKAATGQLELHIRTAHSQGATLSIRELGVDSGLIVLGDYDGDQRCDVLRVSTAPATGLLTWQIDVNGDSNWDETISFGSADDTPILGDWNGDGRDDLGLFRHHLAPHGVNTWLLKGIGQQSDDREVLFGLSGDQPLVADWNGDGRSDIGAVRSTPEVNSFLLDLDFDPASERFVHFGLPGDIPIAFMTSSLPGADEQAQSTE